MGGMSNMQQMGGMQPMGGMQQNNGMQPMGGMQQNGGMQQMGGMQPMGGMQQNGGMQPMGGMQQMGGMQMGGMQLPPSQPVKGYAALGGLARQATMPSPTAAATQPLFPGAQQSPAKPPANPNLFGEFGNLK